MIKQPLRAPRVVALMGLPGAGKTTLAAALAPALALELVSRDRIRAGMFVNPSYTRQEKSAAFDALLLAVRALIGQGRSCVVDGLPFATVVERTALTLECNALGCELLWCYMDCPPQLARQRVEADRGIHPASDRDGDLVDQVAARFAPPEPGVLRLDAALPLQDLVDIVSRRVVTTDC